ncbi:MAG TPA: hypothetical protein VKW06_00575 [Candidatus Angelobacter sp.]|nr:hypothetical protein [Candidatus Angelobacter sp.]
MKGIYTAQQEHVASVIAPVDFTGGKTGRWLSLAKHEHITFILSIGVSAAAPTALLVKGAQDSSGTNAAAIAFDLFTAETATVDLLSTKQRMTTSGYTTISANDDIFYVIEVDASDVAAQLGESFNHVTVNVTNVTNSVIASCVAILSGARFAGDQSPSVNV